MVVGCRRDSKELFAIQVKDNRVTKKVLRPGAPELQWREPLPYELEIDRWELSSRRRRRVMPEAPVAGVVNLSARRGTG